MLSDLMDSKYSVIDTHYDKLENSNALNPIVRTKYLKFRKFFDEGDREMVASLKKECVWLKKFASIIINVFF